MSASTKPMSKELMPPGTGMMAVAVKASSATELPPSANKHGTTTPVTHAISLSFLLIEDSLLVLIIRIRAGLVVRPGAEAAPSQGGRYLDDCRKTDRKKRLSPGFAYLRKRTFLDCR